MKSIFSQDTSIKDRLFVIKRWLVEVPRKPVLKAPFIDVTDTYAFIQEPCALPDCLKYCSETNCNSQICYKSTTRYITVSLHI